MWLTNKLSTGVLDCYKLPPARDKSLSASSLPNAGNLGEALELIVLDVEGHIFLKSISYTIFFYN